MSINSGAAKPSSARQSITVVTLMLVASVALNVALAYKVREFATVQNRQLAKVAEQQLRIGTAVPPFSAKRADLADGRIEIIRYADSDRPSVLYVFTPQCGWCKKNLQSLKTLIAEKGREYRFIGVSLTAEGVTQYASQQGLGIPLYSDITDAVEQAYKIVGTPQTIVVSPKGIVTQRWSGAYIGSQKTQVEKFFGVRLPDIQIDEQKTE